MADPILLFQDCAAKKQPVYMQEDNIIFGTKPVLRSQPLTIKNKTYTLDQIWFFLKHLNLNVSDYTKLCTRYGIKAVPLVDRKTVSETILGPEPSTAFLDIDPATATAATAASAATTATADLSTTTTAAAAAATDADTTTTIAAVPLPEEREIARQRFAEFIDGFPASLKTFSNADSADVGSGAAGKRPRDAGAESVLTATNKAAKRAFKESFGAFIEHAKSETEAIRRHEIPANGFVQSKPQPINTESQDKPTSGAFKSVIDTLVEVREEQFRQHRERRHHHHHTGTAAGSGRDHRKSGGSEAGKQRSSSSGQHRQPESTSAAEDLEMSIDPMGSNLAPPTVESHTAANDSQSTRHRSHSQSKYPPPPSSSSTTASNQKSPSHKKKRSHPIIIVPSAATSLLTKYNIKDFLENGTYIPAAEKKKQMDAEEMQQKSKHSSVVIERRRPNGDVQRYIAIEASAANRLTRDDWRSGRVAAVISNGQKWEFSNWAINDPQEIFARARGCYVHFEGDRVPENVIAWRLPQFAISKTPDMRHLDHVVVNSFWRMLDSSASSR